MVEISMMVRSEEVEEGEVEAAEHGVDIGVRVTANLPNFDYGLLVLIFLGYRTLTGPMGLLTSAF
jgi:hypothetical protein